MSPSLFVVANGKIKGPIDCDIQDEDFECQLLFHDAHFGRFSPNPTPANKTTNGNVNPGPSTSMSESLANITTLDSTRF